ncbi:hypothetical protein [Pseudomonas chlororaphis]|uniref:hypothetical protein n=1 Tax=Pseudomonas chlororaphis TaxID=587753 RepID=UPI000AB40C3B|nr:hypothetical protein [Pseudomonas chlororaphis]
MVDRPSLTERTYDLASPEVYQRRYKRIDDAPLELAEDKRGEAHQLALYDKKLGLGEDAYDKGISWIGRRDRLAYENFKTSAHWLHIPAVFEIDRLFSTLNPEEMEMTPEQFAKDAVAWREIAESLAWQELEEALLTGTRPVLWQQFAGKPCVHNARFGKGSLFLMMYQGEQFAVTAKHVVDGVDPSIFRLVLPENRHILPVFPCQYPTEGSPYHGEELGDILTWRVNVDEVRFKADWWSWRLDNLVRSASNFQPGQKIFAVGFPEFEENFDIENFDIEEHPFIASGHLADTPLVDGVYTMVIDGHLPVLDLNGMSGGPVFARFDDVFHYVGMTIRASGPAARLHFISSEYVVALLDNILATIQASAT